MFQFTEEELRDYTLHGSIKSLMKFIHEYIDKNFSNVTTITFDNIKPYILNLLESYRDKKISCIDTIDTAEAFSYYLQYRYQREESPIDFDAICMNEHHPYSLILKILNYMQHAYNFIMFPEDVPFFIESLEASPERTYETLYKIYDYEEQFDYTERLREANRRGYMTVVIKDRQS